MGAKVSPVTERVNKHSPLVRLENSLNAGNRNQAEVLKDDLVEV